ncbi:YlxR family protein [Desulfovulcanus sp.]
MKKDNKHIPIRTCVICRQKYPKQELVRFTCPETGTELQIDPIGKNPGRGFYVCHKERCQKNISKFRGWRNKCKGVRHV